AGLLAPYTCFELVTALKKAVSVPIHMQCHATTGMSTATYLKAVEAGIDNVDTAISSMSMTYGHSPTESLVAILQGTDRDTGLDIHLLESIAAYFREVRKKYARFEGALKGVDSRILVAQVPGGMLTNLENQLREQNATDRLDEVLEEIPRVREDLGFIALVTPTSQIVGTQAVLNVLAGERYKNITKETEGVLKGEYGCTPAPVNAELQARVLAGAQAVTCRPADLLAPEFERLQEELLGLEEAEGLQLTGDIEDDVLTYALFPQPALKFFANRDNPEAFEPHPDKVPEPKAGDGGVTQVGTGRQEVPEIYHVEVQGRQFTVRVSAGEIADIQPQVIEVPVNAGVTQPAAEGQTLNAPLSGSICKLLVKQGDQVSAGAVVLVLEAMKMETEIRATTSGKVGQVLVKQGDQVSAGDPLLMLT
ncbi:MAG: pyruvate carboxylase subunit B, partial [Gammaproteobacteria bacterium]|nr:pyruvate carboxylase subunit B [Gammaproteobacteria bacterium]